MTHSPYLSKKLDNGVRIIAEKFETVQSVSIGFFFKTGVLYEPKNMLGVSHFIEHMMFKGTSNRNARQIAREFDRIGGYLNAFTAKDYCCFYARTVKDHIGVAVEVLADMLINSLFDEEEFERERRVILEEIKMYEDSPDEIIHELLGQNIWNKSSIGNPILGTSSTVSSMKRDEVVDLFKKQYLTGNLVICVAGNFDWENLQKIVSDKLESMPRGELPQSFEVPESGCSFKVFQKDIEQVHLAMGTVGVSYSDERRFPLTVLNVAFGGGMSSRLFQEIREKRGLAYTVYSYHTSFKNTGLFGIYAGTSMENLSQVLELFYHELEKIAQQGLTETEIAETKEQLKGNMLIALESTTNRMNRLASGFLYGVPPKLPEDTIKPYLNVRKQDIKQIAQDILNEKNMAVTMIAPDKQAVDMLKESRFTSKPVNFDFLSRKK